MVTSIATVNISLQFLTYFRSHSNSLEIVSYTKFLLVLLVLKESLLNICVYIE